MSLRDDFCSDCHSLTAGGCGKHDAPVVSETPAPLLKCRGDVYHAGIAALVSGINLGYVRTLDEVHKDLVDLALNAQAGSMGVQQIVEKHRRHVELSPGVGVDVQQYGIAVCDDILADLHALTENK